MRWVCVCFLTSASGAWAQSAGVPAASPAIEAVKAVKPPVIDGDVSEDEWRAAIPVAGFIEYEPQRGERSPSRTEALVLYDAGHLYVAFRAWDAEPISFGVRVCRSGNKREKGFVLMFANMTADLP